MFAQRYFSGGFFAQRFFPSGISLPVDGGIYLAPRYFAPRYFPYRAVGSVPDVEVITGGHSDGPIRRRPRNKKRFSVFEHIDRLLSNLDSRRLRANEIAQQQATPIIAEHYGLDIPTVSPIEYRTIRLSSLIPRAQEVDMRELENAKMAAEEQAILMILQAVL